MTHYPYHPRHLNADLGIWECHSHRFKIYGIAAENQTITEAMLSTARSYLRSEVTGLQTPDEQHNNLGFVIVHAGELGVSVLVHWWVQGSVLCQQVKRWLAELSEPLDMTSNNVVACVWELGLINKEQLIWRETMMAETADANRYLATRPDINTV